MDTALEHLNNIVVANKNTGLGDALSVFSVLDKERPNISVFANSGHFRELCLYNSHARLCEKNWSGMTLVNCTSVGQPTPDNLGLHFFQKIRKAAGLDYSAMPRAYLFPQAAAKNDKATVCFSFDVGALARVQRAKVHPRAKEFYPEHRESFQKAIDGLSAEFDFVEVGKRSFGFRNVDRQTDISLGATITVMQRCHVYFGMDSGLMHVAAALQLPSAIVVNIPDPELIAFPYQSYAPAIDWLYPQNIHLHEDRRGGSVALVSYASIVESIRAAAARRPGG